MIHSFVFIYFIICMYKEKKINSKHQVKQGLIKIYVSINDLSLHVYANRGLVDWCFILIFAYVNV